MNNEYLHKYIEKYFFKSKRILDPTKKCKILPEKIFATLNSQFTSKGRVKVKKKYGNFHTFADAPPPLKYGK